MALTYQEKQKLVKLLEEKERRQKYSGHIVQYFPMEEDHPYRFDKYPKHLEFFELGKTKRERIFMAANRVGKSVAGGYEMVCHLTGMYPDWWTGRRFDHPTDCWAAGDTGQTTRDILQKELLGEEIGTGLIPRDRIIKVVRKSQPAGSVEKVVVEHASGGQSILGFKSFDQGRRAFQGTAKHAIWLDEECPQDVHNECVIRTMTTQGVVYVTFTPLSGMTAFVQDFMRAANADEEGGTSKAIVMAGWDDVPHLGDKDKADMLASTPEYLKDSRSKGIPGLGSGAIYPFPENEIIVPPMQLMPEWRRFYGMDVGWNFTAVVFCAHDRDRDIVYIYDCFKSSSRTPDVHAAAINRRNVGGMKLAGAIDPASSQRSQIDGRNLIKLYRDCGLKLIPADNSVQSGIDEITNRFATGRLKIFRGLPDIFDELRLYRRNEQGRIVKEADHLMDAMRYALVTGIKYGKPAYQRPVLGGQGKSYI